VTVDDDPDVRPVHERRLELREAAELLPDGVE
jgi:hypothetical protein